MDRCAFQKLFARNVPHILEEIFLLLDYESFKKCLEVSKAWNELLTSDSLRRKAQSLFQREIENDQKRLWIAVGRSESEETIRLLSSGFLDVNLANIFSYSRLSRNDGFSSNIMNMEETLLHRAAKHAQEDVVQLLLDKGAEPNRVNHLGETPLSLAAYYQSYYDRIDVAKVLLDAGADPNHVDMFGFTPLCVAARNSLEMVRLLIARGANCTPKDIDHAREHGRTDIVTFLTEKLQ